MGVPNRGTSEQALDQWNQQMRASPVYQQFMQRNGLPTNGRVKLSKDQQSALESALRAAGTPVPSGMHIDQGGNLNQKNRLVRNAAITAGVLAGGYFAAPAIAGALGAGGAAGGAGAAGAAALPAAATAGMIPASTAAGIGAAGAATLPAAATAGMIPASTAGSAAAGGGLFTAGNAAKAGTIGRILGNAGQGAANQRLGENQQGLSAAQIDNAHAVNAARTDLDQKKFLQDEPGAQARQAAIGSLLARIQPLSMTGLSPRVQQSMPKMNSIIDAISPEARQAGSLLSARGLSGLQAGPSQLAPLPPSATADALKKSGLLEKILGGAGVAGSVLGGLGTFSKPEDFYNGGG